VLRDRVDRTRTVGEEAFGVRDAHCFRLLDVDLHAILLCDPADAVHYPLQVLLTACSHCLVISISDHTDDLSTDFNPSSSFAVASFTIASSYVMNSSGDKEQPCRTPRPIWHAADKLFPTCADADCP